MLTLCSSSVRRRCLLAGDERRRRHAACLPVMSVAGDMLPGSSQVQGVWAKQLQHVRITGVCVCPCAIGTAVSAGTATAASRCCRRLPLRSPGRLASASTALHRVNAIKEDVRWERGAAAAVLDAAMVEMPLTGMQMALEMMMDKKCCNKLLDHDHHHIIMEMRDQIRLALLTHSSNKQQSTAAAAADGGGGAFISKPQISSL